MNLQKSHLLRMQCPMCSCSNVSCCSDPHSSRTKFLPQTARPPENKSSYFQVLPHGRNCDEITFLKFSTFFVLSTKRTYLKNAWTWRVSCGLRHGFVLPFLSEATEVFVLYFLHLCSTVALVEDWTFERKKVIHFSLSERAIMLQFHNWKTLQ